MTAPLNITARIGAVGDPDRLPRRTSLWSLIGLAIVTAPFWASEAIVWAVDLFFGEVGS